MSYQLSDSTKISRAFKGLSLKLAPKIDYNIKVVIGDYTVISLVAMAIHDIPDRSAVSGNPPQPLSKK